MPSKRRVKANSLNRCEAPTTDLYVKLQNRYHGNTHQGRCQRVAKYNYKNKCYCGMHLGLVLLEQTVATGEAKEL